MSLTDTPSSDARLRLISMLSSGLLNVNAERALLNRLEGGCHVPIGAYAVIDGDELTLDGVVASPDGTKVIRDSITGPVQNAWKIGETLADTLRDSGGAEILAALEESV